MATLVYLFTWPDDSLTFQTAQFVSRFPRQDVRRAFARNIDVVRNNVMKACLESDPVYDRFLWIDRDMRPDERTEPIFEADADIVGVNYPLGAYKGGCGPEAEVHAGLLLMKRSAVSRLPMPWFRFICDDRGLEYVCCECGYFMSQAARYGLSIAKTGYCEHDWRRAW